MANIGFFGATEQWDKVDDITEVSLVADSSYTIQNRGNNPLLVCSKATEPEEFEGFILEIGEAFGYTAKSGEYLWLRSVGGNTKFNIAEGI